MIPRNDSRISRPTWLRGTLALLAACVLPLGLIQCGPDDGALPPETVNRLDAAGSSEQDRDDSDAAADVRSRELREVEAHLRQAVESGEMSPQEAEAQMARLRDRADDVADSEEVDEGIGPEGLDRLAEERARLHAQIRAGQLTEAQAEQRYEELKKQIRDGE